MRRASLARSGRTSTARPLLHRLLLTVLVTGVCGVVVAAMGIPVVSGLGLVAKHQTDHFLALPSDLTEPPLAQHSVLLDDQGHTLATLAGTEDRTIVSLDQIPKVMQLAIIDIEDNRFYEHHGVDLRGSLRALVHNGSGGSTQGGSTLTQQYVKNVLEHSTDPKVRAEATQDTLARKLQEARYALALERRYSKGQILEKYLNIANFGNGKYGVNTAALYYFREPVANLTFAQAALLAGIVNGPSLYDPFMHPKAATDRRTEVLAAMRKQGDITQAQYDEGVAEPLPTKPPATNVDPCVHSEAPFFCTWVVHDVLLQDPKLGATEAEREERLFNGGLIIKTTLDMKTQKATEKAVSQVVPANKSVVAMAAAVQPGTGNVLALAADRPYGIATKQQPLAVVTPFAARAYLHPGSTFKAFTLATALKQGLPLQTSFYAGPTYRSTKLANPADGAYHNAGDSEQCYCNMVSGTWNSVNTYYVQLEEKVGVLNARNTAIAMGLPPATLGSVDAATGSFTLGAVNSVKPPITNGESALTMASAYATLAAHGIACPVHFATIAKDVQGNKIALSQKPCYRALPAKVADEETAILEGVLSKGTAAGKGLLDRVAAGKTGTTDDEAAAWFVGYLPQLAIAVGMGDPNNPSKQMCYLGNCEIFGGTYPAQIWNQAMTAALQGVPAKDMPSSAEVNSVGVLSTLPNVHGMTVLEAEGVLRKAGLTWSVSQTLVNSDLPKGYVVSVSAYGGGLVINVASGTDLAGHPVAKPSPSPSAAPPPAASSAPAAGPAAGGPAAGGPAPAGTSPTP